MNEKVAKSIALEGLTFSAVGDITGPARDMALPKMLNEGLVLANFEGAVSSGRSGELRARKMGPIITADRPSFKLGDHCLWNLSNNHAMDLLWPGVARTKIALEDNSSTFIGIGASVSEARSPISLKLKNNGMVLTFVAVCERQYGGATSTQGGVAEFGAWVYRAIADARTRSDIVIVSSHAGAEDSLWPSPNLQQTYKSMIDVGAHAVIGHHSHVPQGFEQYGDGFIAYGLGNFAAPPNKWSTYYHGHVSWILNFPLDAPFKSDAIQMDLVDTAGECVRPATDQSTPDFMSAINGPLEHEDRLGALWQEVSMRLLCAYSSLGIVNVNMNAKQMRRFVVRAVFRRDKEKIPSTRFGNFLGVHHMLSCPTHHHALESAFGILSGVDEDTRTSETAEFVDTWAPNLATRAQVDNMWTAR